VADRATGNNAQLYELGSAPSVVANPLKDLQTLAMIKGRSHGEALDGVFYRLQLDGCMNVPGPSISALPARPV
jgi:hypothetical protein